MTALSIPELELFIQDILNMRPALSPRAEWGRLRQTVIDSLDAQVTSTIDKIIDEQHRVPPQDGEETVRVIHYTSLSAIVSILKSAQPCDKEGYLRMYSSARSNDPDEGRYLFKQYSPTVSAEGKDLASQLSKFASKTQVDTYSPLYAYIASFIQPDDISKPECAANKLVFWRAYGRDGRGCSLIVTIKPDSLLKVKYGSKVARETWANIQSAYEHICQCIRNTNNEFGIEALKDWGKTNLPAHIQKIAYLYKSEAYEYENECRIVRLSKEKGAENPQIEFIDEPCSVTTTRYLEIPELCANSDYGILQSGSVITLGPQVSNSRHTKQDIKELLHQANLSGTKVERSKISYRSNVR